MRRLLACAAVAAVLGACSRAPAPPVAEPAAPVVRPPAPEPAPAPAPNAATADVQPAAEDWELPGGLGPLTTRLELDARFGKANVREVTFPGAEGIGSYPALVLFPDDPRKRLELVLDAADPDAPIRELRVPAPDSLWHATSGLRTGISLAELVALNGAPVSFYGLGWDYGGTVQDWHGGKLANAVGATLFHRVALSARDPSAATALPLGDGTFRSDDRRWPALGEHLVVAELGISWPHEGED